jgi:hypothetical protein
LEGVVYFVEAMPPDLHVLIVFVGEKFISPEPEIEIRKDPETSSGRQFDYSGKLLLSNPFQGVRIFDPGGLTLPFHLRTNLK